METKGVRWSESDIPQPTPNPWAHKHESKSGMQKPPWSIFILPLKQNYLNLPAKIRSRFGASWALLFCWLILIFPWLHPPNHRLVGFNHVKSTILLGQIGHFGGLVGGLLGVAWGSLRIRAACYVWWSSASTEIWVLCWTNPAGRTAARMLRRWMATTPIPLRSGQLT